MRKSITAQSYYQFSAHNRTAYARLQGDIDCDVAVVGAGYTGLSAALELSKAGYRVAVLEAEHVGFGASGRNGGQICTGFSPGQARLETQVSKSDALKCFAIAEEAKTLIESRIAEHDISCDLQWGYLHCIPKPSQMKMLRDWAAEYEELGYTGCQVLSREALAAKLGTSLYHGAMREPRAGHFHPLNYLLGLANAAAKSGVQTFENSRVVEFETGKKPWLRTSSGKVNAKFLILAMNGYLDEAVRKLKGRIMPVTSFIVTTEPLGENRAKALIPDNEAVADTNFILDYFRRTADNRLLFGGRANYSTMEPADVGAEMKQSMLKVFPQLADVQIEHAWGGYIAITSNRIPDCGRLSPTTYYAHGYSGQGVALAQMYGKLMSDAIRGQAERFDMLAQFRHLPFPGGPIRMPLLVAAMTWYRLKDKLG
jgi:gamma-glutamylputrescine oxidase